MKVNILLYVKTVKLIQKEEKGYETKKTVICFTCRSDGRKRWQHFRSGGDYTGSCSGSIFYRMERAAGVFQVNREAARATFYSFDTAEKAKAKDQTKSSFYKLLNGDDWKFSWAVKPSDRIGVKDANFNQKDYDDSSWDDITVPKSWQTYVKEDGSWKYDPVIYSNQNYPWMNAEAKITASIR